MENRRQPSVASLYSDELGQRVLKIASNVFFGFFVVLVLTFTVFAITYKPPDPWLQSLRSYNELFSSVDNSTFQHDDSILVTGDDLKTNVDAAPGPKAITEEDVQNTPVQLAGSCDSSTSVINCSDPAVKSSIERYNFLKFPALSFYEYRDPVGGAAKNECDIAWKYRSKRAKTRRIYRDFRRYILKKDAACAISVHKVGKWHSGINARPRKGGDASSTTDLEKGVDVVEDSLGPASLQPDTEFYTQRYLYYERGGDYCKSMSQFEWSFLCALGEARYLNRTFVMDLDFCLAGANNPGHEDETNKDFRFYFDYEHLQESTPMIEKNTFLQELQEWNSKHKTHAILPHYIPNFKVAPSSLQNDTGTVLWRRFDDVVETNNYWYRVCEGEAEKYVERPWNLMWKSRRLMDIVTAICNKLEWDFDTVHVVRGEKAKNKQLWPNLDADTSPESLLSKVQKQLDFRRKIYIATNEMESDYFDKLRSWNEVYLLDDFKELWSNTSEWYKSTLALTGGQPVEFDGYMRVIVDTEMLYRGKKNIETFNDLTGDCKNGVGRC
jgi:hypothetical protein